MDANNQYTCPVCNGFSSLEEKTCPKCGSRLADQGRFTDLFNDYSPYRAIDDVKMTDGLPDAENHLCPHILFCTSCKFSNIFMVEEIPINKKPPSS
ncbi:hypothetical protein [Thermoactinomyces mirandus]|uniref:Uncharacterized protein n=1 Tax=Thermoactinomyces mirandus TaxID=2756294 RepID=A0A7W2AQT8_9BACL|nr:hypothetical protein [Thermoactinomyces mirandus]MBA4602299.1 hypothetical protein [Thermoactinomyces mirandus]